MHDFGCKYQHKNMKCYNNNIYYYNNRIVQLFIVSYKISTTIFVTFMTTII